jgi:hypothetical protein
MRLMLRIIADAASDRAEREERSKAQYRGTIREIRRQPIAESSRSLASLKMTLFYLLVALVASLGMRC